MKYSVFEVWISEDGREERDLKSENLTYEAAMKDLAMLQFLYSRSGEKFVIEEQPDDVDIWDGQFKVGPKV